MSKSKSVKSGQPAVSDAHVNEAARLEAALSVSMNMARSVVAGWIPTEEDPQATEQSKTQAAVPQSQGSSGSFSLSFLLLLLLTCTSCYFFFFFLLLSSSFFFFFFFFLILPLLLLLLTTSLLLML